NTPRIANLEIECIRCDDVEEPGSIHQRMFEFILDTDIAIVDMTILNPNVFYELGVRHSLHRNGTIMIRQASTRIPFNLNGYSTITYDYAEDKRDWSKQQIQAYVINSIDKEISDSPIYDMLGDQFRFERTANWLEEQEYLFEHEVVKAPGKTIGIITGDIQKVKGIDVWVNSENINMQMARYLDYSLSGIIRYMGARKSNSHVISDTIAEELAKSMNGYPFVFPGTVVPTNSGELLSDNQVKKIFHAASVIGAPGRGYRVIDNIEDCITGALKMMDDPDMKGEKLESILIPLIGTGAARGKLHQIVGKLVKHAVVYLRENPASQVKKVYFLASRASERDSCKFVFNGLAEEGFLKNNTAS
ncbi:MAG: hypothetical protein AAFP19_21635, partial [Bacteroidota bacterium]